jgi:eukaryotic-like serine/threonine-protein kinase
MAISSSGMLMDALRQQSLLSPGQLAQLPNLAQGRCGDARLFAKILLQKGWLTVYQVNQLLAGNGHELVIGPYYVLDKLGQGGLSSVYKGKHREYDNLVAIKMIRPEVFASPEGRQQFLQEVEAMARLDHPNIVQFCDADQFKDSFYFAMEYVDGTDMGKVVRLSGALPVHEACDYTRQAALGLQHAYERNLIHRDIKPVNLFLTHVNIAPGDSPGAICAADAIFATRHELTTARENKSTMQMKPIIKILDWGLASLRSPKGPNNGQTEDVEKNLVGTADYLSPEQARNANTVDIRGDIYSLGCTLYFLLTGQAPFPDGALMQKIFQHQQGEPRPISEFRGDVPDGVLAILKRMMAKTPEDRFQTPASVGLALMPFTRRRATLSSGALPAIKGTLPAPSADTPLPAKLASADEGIFRMPGRNAASDALGANVK